MPYLSTNPFTNGLPAVEQFKYDIGEGEAKYMRTDCEGIWVTNRKKTSIDGFLCENFH